MVRALEVVEVSPGIEAALAMVQVGVDASLEQFALEGLVEALELAEGLGVAGSAVYYSDSQLQQPDCKGGEGVVEVVAPGGAVVYQHGDGHAVVTEYGGEMVTDRLSLLICTGSDPKGEPGVVVEDCQWMASSTTGHGYMSLEVHLPKIIGSGVL